MADPQRFLIVNGPSKWDLMLALLDGDCTSRRRVVFSLQSEKNKSMPVPDQEFIINGIDREDGSGEGWLIRGISTAPHDKRMQAYFSTKTRHGWLKLI